MLWPNFGVYHHMEICMHLSCLLNHYPLVTCLFEKKKNKQKQKKIKIKLSADRNSQHYSRDLNSDILTFVFSPISSLFDLDVFFFPEFKIH